MAKKMSPLDVFVYWIQERESIRLKKEADEPKPWTKDKILQSYRFCNVRRMDDKVSKWLLKNWYKPNFNHPLMLHAVALARFINKPETLIQIGFPPIWSPEEIKQGLRDWRDKGNKVFGAAYMVRGNDGEDKISSVIDYYCSPLKDVEIDTSSMEKTHALIQTSHGFGSFMAGQVVADLRHAVKGSWKDKRTWAPIGPGSRRGMNRIMGRDVSESLSQKQFLEELLALIEKVSPKLPESITKRLECHDWQNCLCETDKYNRVLHGEGRPKQRYEGIDNA